MKKLVAILCVIAVVTAGCKAEFSPLVSGEVLVTGNKSAISLSSDQITALQSWLEKSKSGWGRCLYTPPGSTVSVSLHHADGSQSTISLLKFPSEQKQTTMKASRPSGSSLNDQPCAFQTFSEQEVESFKSIIGIAP